MIPRSRFGSGRSLVDPGKVRFQRASGFDGNHDELGQLVRVQCQEGDAQRIDSVIRDLHQKCDLRFIADLPLPAVETSHGQQLDTGGQSGLDQRPSDALRMCRWNIGDREFQGGDILPCPGRMRRGRSATLRLSVGRFFPGDSCYSWAISASDFPERIGCPMLALE